MKAKYFGNNTIRLPTILDKPFLRINSLSFEMVYQMNENLHLSKPHL